ncbi:hypothetical protein F8M41_024458 [Gigaspora margarita]|uniref:Uncharacterized protein n=1 Tax=Gigaspora margarita TaxID=4874 RepID=A0A8H3XK95_GIGMA|nr:hypothetical protein F8M41_024458 [Gigaspora margarita]
MEGMHSAGYSYRMREVNKCKNYHDLDYRKEIEIEDALIIAKEFEKDKKVEIDKMTNKEEERIIARNNNKKIKERILALKKFLKKKPYALLTKNG